MLIVLTVWDRGRIQVAWDIRDDKILSGSSVPSWFLQMYMSFSALLSLVPAHRRTYGSCFPLARNTWNEASSMNSVCSTTCTQKYLRLPIKIFCTSGFYALPC